MSDKQQAERGGAITEFVCCCSQSAAKRLRVTGTGKLVGRHAGKQHFNEKMSRSTIR